MSRQNSGKSPISVLAWRFSLFIVTPFYLFIVWVFHPVLNTDTIVGKVWWLLVWWLFANIGGFSLSVGLGWPMMRAWCDFLYRTRREYWDWLRAGGDPFWDVLPWPINADPAVARMAIGIPPDHDTCPHDGYPLGQRFGNQCRSCGRFFDKGYPAAM